MFVNVSEFGHWVCGESWHATEYLQPTAPVLKAGHPVSYSFLVRPFVSLAECFLGFFVLLSFYLLVYCTPTMSMYISMYMYMYMSCTCQGLQSGATGSFSGSWSG